jgi:hypothetical protein
MRRSATTDHLILGFEPIEPDFERVEPPIHFEAEGADLDRQFVRQPLKQALLESSQALEDLL